MVRGLKKVEVGAAKLVCGDCNTFLRSMPDKCVDLVITSPPYCMRKEYEESSKVEDFEQTHLRILPEIYRVVKDGGSICWQIGYHVHKGIVTPLDYLVYAILSRFKDIHLRNRIVWTYGHGLHCSSRFSGRHETILWFTKGDKYIFDLDRVRVPQLYPGKRHYKGPNKGEPSGNPLGKNPSDVWEIPNVKAHHVEKTSHPCQFPVALALRLIKALTEPKQLVLDPFMGAGTTAVAALLEKRSCLGLEMEPAYWAEAVKRCKAVIKQTIQYRSLDKSVTRPNSKHAVARVPDAWQGTTSAKKRRKTWQEPHPQASR